MTLKKVLSSLTVFGAVLAAGLVNVASAATNTSCQAPIVRIADTNVCSQANVNYVGFGTSSTVSNRLFRINAGAGVQTEARNAQQLRLNPRCRTGVNRNTSGVTVTKTGCTGTAFHQTFIVP
jgi:hypothetical protein